SARSSCRAGQVQPCRSSNQVTVRPPRRRQPQLVASPATSLSPRPPSASPPQARNCGTPLPPRSVTSTRTTPPAARTSIVTVSPSAPEPPYRMLLANSSLTSSAASSPHGCPGPSTPAVNARATRARSARPATVTLSRTTALAIRAPAFPARPRPGKPPGTAGGTYGDARPTRRPASSQETAAGAARPWPSVKQPTVRTDREGARIPSAMRPWTPRHSGSQRDKMTYHGTEKNGPHSREFPASGPFSQVVAGVGFEPT